MKLSIPTTIKRGWENSPLRELPAQTPQFKGSLGTKIIKELMEEKGYTAKVISDRGDLEYTKDGKTFRSEVKTACAAFKFNKAGNVSGESFWWNQIRPDQEGWTHLHLVALHPEYVMVYEFNRENAEALVKDEEIGGDGHTTGDAEGGLKKVVVKKNTRSDNFNRLDIYGTMITKDYNLEVE